MQTVPLRSPTLDVWLHRAYLLLQKRGPKVAAWAFFLASLWTLAQLTWMFLPQPTPPQPPVSAVAAAPRMFDAGHLADQHLFGVANQPVTAGTNAPETTLALILHGIVAGHSAATSRALIVANGDEEPYGLGAQLPGGAIIRAIYPDRVMLEREGRMETLRLPKAESGGAVNTAAPDQTVAPNMPAAVPTNLSELRQEVVNNPQKLMDVVRAMPVMDKKDNKLTGYRVYPAGNPNLFNQLGLRAGDVVTAVNGIPLTDPAQSMRILSALKTSDQISISVIRNGQEQNQVLQLQAASQDDDE